MIQSTLSHPFYDNNLGWIKAQDIQVGSSLVGKDAETIVPLSVEIIHHITNVYNFEVDDNHNYFLGLLGILVHNACNPALPVGEATEITTKNGEN